MRPLRVSLALPITRWRHDLVESRTVFTYRPDRPYPRLQRLLFRLLTRLGAFHTQRVEVMTQAVVRLDRLEGALLDYIPQLERFLGTPMRCLVVGPDVWLSFLDAASDVPFLSFTIPQDYSSRLQFAREYHRFEEGAPPPDAYGRRVVTRTLPLAGVKVMLVPWARGMLALPDFVEGDAFGTPPPAASNPPHAAL